VSKTIAVIGRPNVGKSALVNALLNRREVPISDNPGLTRDRNYAHFETSSGNEYLLIDTGGLIFNSGDTLNDKVNLQAEVAIDQADLILFVTDIKEGCMPVDEEIADKLRKTSKPVILVVNKADSPSLTLAGTDFYKLGYKNIIAVSALHKRNIYDLIEIFEKLMPSPGDGKKERHMHTLCITGKPNVGKSTLLNTLLGQERVIVDEKPGTTRNPARSYMDINDDRWRIIDLAGLHRKRRGKEVEEIISMVVARKEIEKSDVCILMLDLTKPLTFQDKRIASWIIESSSAVIVVGNKVDITEEYTSEIAEAYRMGLYAEMPYLNFAPFIMISAKEGYGLKKIFSELKRIMESYYKVISDEELGALIKKLIKKRPPPPVASERPSVIKFYQKHPAPPVFNMGVKHHRVDKIPQHWKNYIKNSIRKEFGFYGVPLELKIYRERRK
jgi:GTP-binding protein